MVALGGPRTTPRPTGAAPDVVAACLGVPGGRVRSASSVPLSQEPAGYGRARGGCNLLWPNHRTAYREVPLVPFGWRGFLSVGVKDVNDSRLLRTEDEAEDGHNR